MTNTGFEKSPLVSLIMISLNREKVIESAIQAVLSQTYKNMGLIIIDGGSTDNTVKIIQKYDSKIDYWVSEKDSSPAEAYNKGLKASKGEIIAHLPTDEWVEKDYVEKIVRGFENHPDAGFLYGDAVFYDDSGKFLYRVSGNIPPGREIPGSRWLATRKSVFDTHGILNTKFPISSDSEFVLRIMAHGMKASYVPATRYMQDDGMSSSRWFISNWEHTQSSIFYGGKPFKIYLRFLAIVIKTCTRNFLTHIFGKRKILALRSLWNKEIELHDDKDINFLNFKPPCNEESR